MILLIYQCPSIQQSINCIVYAQRISFRMREKRQRKPRKLLEDSVDPFLHIKNKPIKRITRKCRADHQKDEEEQMSDEEKFQSANPKPNDTKKSDNKEISDPLNLDLDNDEEQGEQTKKESCTKLSSLAKLFENFKESKTLYEENLAKYNYHKTECEELSQKVKQNNEQIEMKAKQLKQFSRGIYVESVRKNREEFLDPRTFSDRTKFNQFLQNLKNFVEIINNCPYEDPFESLRMTKVLPEMILAHKQMSIRQHKKDVALREHFYNLPYLTTGEENIPLIQAMIISIRYTQNPISAPAQQFPCLFMRETSLNYSTQQICLSMMYNLITSLDFDLAGLIHGIVSEKNCILSPAREEVQELLFKGISSIKFISFPQVLFELRNFSYQRYLYINTYYIEADLSLSKEVKVAYCVLVGIRELANYVEKSILYSLDRSEEDVGRNIRDVRERIDLGAKLEKVITKGAAFICASKHDYNNLCSRQLKQEQLGRDNTQLEDCYLFQEERKRRDSKTENLLFKYKHNSAGKAQQQQRMENEQVKQQVPNAQEEEKVQIYERKHIEENLESHLNLHD